MDSFYPNTTHENFETRNKQRRNRNPRNPIVSRAPVDVYSLYNQSQPGYHEPSSQKDDSSENRKWFTKRNILISVVVIGLVLAVVVVAMVAIPKNAPGKRHDFYFLLSYFYPKQDTRI